MGFVELRDDLLDFRLIEICEVMAERLLFIVAEPTFHVGFQLLDVNFHLFELTLQVADTRLDFSLVFLHGTRHHLVPSSLLTDTSKVHFDSNF